MTTAWGPAFDAEIEYRQQIARTDFRRRLWHRTARRTTGTRVPQGPQSVR
jgi:hypothetical protein